MNNSTINEFVINRIIIFNNVKKWPDFYNIWPRANDIDNF